MFGGRLDPHGGHLQPLKLAVGLARAAESAGVRIFERTRAESLSGTMANTARGSVQASAVLLAGNAYLGPMAPKIGAPLQRKALAAATYMIATAPLAPHLAATILPGNAAVCDTNHVLEYFRRSADGRLLFGAELTTEPRPPEWIRRKLGRRMVRAFPPLADVPIDHAWHGLIDLSTARLPHIGKLDDHVWFAQGFFRSWRRINAIRRSSAGLGYRRRRGRA